MSLHALAHHMSSKGRGGDSMLVHMTPGEVAGLQALALKHGGSLSINPETGLVEANFFKKLLPLAAGFLLGPAGFGIAQSALGAAAMVGGVTGLATGSLSKGLTAGLGAYGGFGLGQSLVGAGAGAVGAGVGAGVPTDMAFNLESAGLGTANADIASQAVQGIQPSAFDKVGAGFNAITKDPSALGQFAKDNWKYGLAAASPLIADAMVPTATKMPEGAGAPPGYIRPFQYDENTRTVRAMDPVLASEWGARQFPDFIRKGQTPPPPPVNQNPYGQPQGLGRSGYIPPGGMAAGGIVALADGGSADPYAQYNTLSGQSKNAYDYLMGDVSGVDPTPMPVNRNPVVSNTNAPVVTPAPSTSMTTTPVTGGGGGGGIGGGGGGGGGASVGNAGSDTGSSTTYSGFVPEPANPNIPVEDRKPEPVTPSPDEDFPSTYPEPVMPSPDEDFPSTYPEPVTPSPDEDFPSTYPEPVMPSPDEDFPSTSLDQPYNNSDYEVQPWENVDNSGYTDNSMAGDNSFNSDKNTYTGAASESPQGMPDAIGSYPSESTYIGNDDGGGGDWWFDDGNSLDDDFNYQGNANGGLMGYADGGMLPQYAMGGLGSLGGYSDGGRLLKGPGDGVSDSIPATIGAKKQPARLADGEFVIPARIVSELGNGSTDAGARKLYAMMDRIQKSRRKTVGKNKVAANPRADKHLPA